MIRLMDNSDCTTCTRCEAKVEWGGVEEVEGDILCEDCFNERTNQCHDCHDNFYQDNLNYLEGINIYVCHDCYDNYRYCDGCNEHYSCECMDYYNGEYLCENCIDSERSEDSHDNFDGHYTFYRLPNEPQSSLYFGIELEAGTPQGSNINFHRDIVDKLPECVFSKDDGSILDCSWIEKDIEIVSHPMTYKWLKRNRHQWNKILKLREKGLRSYTTNSCGIHIHLTKSYFTEKHLYYFMKMIYHQPTFTLLISQRRKAQLRSWSGLTDKEDKGDLRKKAKDKHFYKRYTAVNLSNTDTIEIRIFRGTLDECAFWKNIEYIQALIEFTKKAKKKNLTLKSFLKYIKSHRRKFGHLYKWLRKKNKIK